MIHDQDRGKLIKAGFRLFEKDESLLCVREYTPEGWKVCKRTRCLNRLRRFFDGLMKTPNHVRA